jgi:protein required for attachment to host cells
MIHSVYVLLADSSHAKVFSTQAPLQKLALIRHFEHEESKLKKSETYSERPGRQQSDFGGSHSYAGDLQTHEAEKFAAIICDFLEAEMGRKQFTALVLVAAPKMLGELRKHLGKASSTRVLATLDKDIVNLPEPELAEYLIGHVPQFGPSV